MFDYLNLAISGTVLFIYGSSCIISAIFTFSIETYRRMEDKLQFEIFSMPIINPLDIKINTVNVWVSMHNKIFGPIMILLSVIDLSYLLHFARYF